MSMTSDTHKLAQAWMAGWLGVKRDTEAQWCLTAMMAAAWDQAAPSMDDRLGIQSPSTVELEAIAGAMLRSVGIDPAERADTMLQRITVNVLHAVPRLEFDLQRLQDPMEAWAVGVANSQTLIAILQVQLEQGHRLTVQFYRTPRGTAAIVCQKEVDARATGCLAVYFTTQEAKHGGLSWTDPVHCRWFVGWRVGQIKPSLTGHQVGVRIRGASPDRKQLGFRQIFGRLFRPLLAPFQKPANRRADAGEPRQ